MILNFEHMFAILKNAQKTDPTLVMGEQHWQLSIQGLSKKFDKCCQGFCCISTYVFVVFRCRNFEKIHILIHFQTQNFEKIMISLKL